MTRQGFWKALRGYARRADVRLPGGRRLAAQAAPLVRDAPRRARRRPARGAGDARPRRHLDDADLHAGQPGPHARAGAQASARREVAAAVSVAPPQSVTHQISVAAARAHAVVVPSVGGSSGARHRLCASTSAVAAPHRSTAPSIDRDDRRADRRRDRDGRARDVRDRRGWPFAIMVDDGEQLVVTAPGYALRIAPGATRLEVALVRRENEQIVVTGKAPDPPKRADVRAVDRRHPHPARQRQRHAARRAGTARRRAPALLVRRARVAR